MAIITNIVNLIAPSIVSYLNTLFNQLDPVQDLAPNFWNRFSLQTGIQSSAKSKRFPALNQAYIFPILIFMLHALWGVIGLEYEATGAFSFSNLRSSPYIFSHQIIEPSLWTEGDILSSHVHVFPLVVYLAYIFHGKFGVKHLMLYNGRRLIVNSKGNLWS